MNVLTNTFLPILSTHHHSPPNPTPHSPILTSTLRHCLFNPPLENTTLLSALNACVQTRSLRLPLQLHAHVAKLPLNNPPNAKILSTCLLKFYGSVGLLRDARELFVRIPERDSVAVCSFMVACCRAGEFEEGMKAFSDGIGSGDVDVNEYLLSCALRACACGLLLQEGRQVHARVIKSSSGSNIYVGTALVDMYVKCGDVEGAKMVFWDAPEKTVASWNALISGDFCGEEVLEMFLWMRVSGVCPDHVTFASVLRACKDFDLGLARCIHGLVVKVMEEEVDVFVGEALFVIYVGHDRIYEAQRIFRQMHDKDVVAFILAIEAFNSNGYFEEALELFYEAIWMFQEVDEAVITKLISGVKGLHEGKQLHGLAVKLGFYDGDSTAYIFSSLISMYSNCKCVDDAARIFEKISSPDLILWTSLISGFSSNGCSESALLLYIRMLSDESTDPPNNYTFSCLLDSCADLIAVEEGRQIHCQVIKALSCTESDQFISNALLHMYAKCGYIEEARTIFHAMKDPDLPSWNAMICGLAEHGFASEALATSNELLNHAHLEPNHVTFLGVLSACSHRGMVEMGYQYFGLIREPTIDHYACLINMVARAGRLDEAGNLIKKMPFQPNEHIWSSLLSASNNYKNIELAEYSAKRLLEIDAKNPGTYIALSNAYATAGRWDSVKFVRKMLEEQGVTKNPGCSWIVLNGKKYSFLAQHWR